MSSTSDEELLQAIAAAPDDPEPRLVYADHRLGHAPNDPHAELIVVQCRLAELDATEQWTQMFSVEAERLRAREKELIGALLDEVDLPAWLIRSFSRGFADDIAVYDATIENLGKRITHPLFRVIRELRFLGPRTDISPLLEHFVPTVRRVSGLLDEDQISLLIRAGADLREVSIGAAQAWSALQPFVVLDRLEIDDDDALADLDIAYLRRARHLALKSDEPVPGHMLDRLAVHGANMLDLTQSIELHLGSEDAARALRRHPRPFGRTTFVPYPTHSTLDDALSHAAIARAYVDWSRDAEAIPHFEFAYWLGHDVRAELEALTHRSVVEPSSRDGHFRILPGIVRSGDLDRALVAAPNHAGALALKGIRLRDRGDVEGARLLFVRALEGELSAEEIPDTARAHARNEYALRGNLRELARQIEKRRVNAPPSRFPASDDIVEEFLVDELRAVLQPVPRDRGFGQEYLRWLERNPKRRPKSLLAFETLLWVAAEHYPNADLSALRRQIDAGRGA